MFVITSRMFIDMVTEYIGMQIETFRIQYVDNTYQLVEWTNEEFFDVAKDMSEGRTIAVVNRCLYRLIDIRAIVYIPPVSDVEAEKDAQVITESGVYERELFEQLKEMGYELGEVKGGLE